MAVVTMGAFLITGNALFPAILALDFYIRAFTRLRYSPLSFTGHLMIRMLGTKPILIDKAPKVFAARIGLLLSIITLAAAMLGLPWLAVGTGAILVAFAFLECGLNFCAGCWVYTVIVYPLVRKGR